MKHIKNYINKIEAIIATQLSKENKKPKSKGLLSATKDMSEETPDKLNDVDVVARFVYGIRKAKEEMINDSK